MSKINSKNNSQIPSLIVGLGASAGGMESFKAFFSQMPEKPGMAFVLLPHLDPNHSSLMSELLSSETHLPVTEMQDNMLVEPDHVYILPPANRVTFASGRLHLEATGELRQHWTAIEAFLTSLAYEQKQRAVAIIMSGTGNHGTQGLREIKRNGGLILAQNPTTCKYPQMPKNAIKSALVDRILAPEDMPQVLVEYANHPYLISLNKSASEQDLIEMQQILTLLRKRIKHDFSSYRKNMLLRRIQRRMSVCHCQTFAEYRQYLTVHTEETMQLCRDLLIGVTAFFRDPEAFQVIQQRVCPDLVASCSDDDPVRVWVPACSSGEEAYSLAMLILDEFERVGKEPSLQIFASDIDEESLKVARQGIYPEALMSNISPERVHRYFSKIQSNHYKVNPLLRKCIVFASQNLIGDAPFSRLDLVSCRNFLIYLETEQQQKVLRLFNFSLKSGGYLILGPSESLGQKNDLFTTVSKKWRIFKHKEQECSQSVDMSIYNNSIPLALVNNNQFPANSITSKTVYNELVQKALLKFYAPAAVLINAKYQVLHFQGPTVDYLEFPSGLPSIDLTVLVREGLRTRLRALLNNAKKIEQTVVDCHARVKRQRHYFSCTISIRPMLDQKNPEKLYLVTFQDNPASHALSSDDIETINESSVINQLEDELVVTREDLQKGIEELKTSNEEIMSMNEEMQSANEELETSKEELQSSNEELITVNTELTSKLEELRKSNDDISNLLSSTDIATVFLDREMKIMLFNPAIAKLLNLRDTDIGRPISDITSKLANVNLLKDAQSVLESLTPVERDIFSRTDDSDIAIDTTEPCYLRRIVPYRTSDERISGVVVTFVNITERYQQKLKLEKLVQERTQELHERENRLLAIMDHASEGIIVINDKGFVTQFNRAAEQIFGYASREIIGFKVNRLMPEPYATEHDNYLASFQKTGESKIMYQPRTLFGLHKNGIEFPIEITVNQVDNLNIYVGLIRDMSEKRALQKLITEFNNKNQEMLGIELHDNLGQRLTGINLLLESFKQKHINNKPKQKEAIDNISMYFSQAIGEIRRISHGLSPIAITPDGLQDALKELTYIDESQNINIQVQFSLSNKIENRIIATELFRIVQEAFNNALKHAHAKNILITLEEYHNRIQLSITDDGIGFNLQHQYRNNGIGLRIMQYRAENIGGKFRIETTLGKGTRIICTY